MSYPFSGQTNIEHDPTSCSNDFDFESRSLRSQKQRPCAWKQFYARIADKYHCMNGDQKNLGLRVIEHLCRAGLLEPGSRILDIGCGPGTFALPLAGKGLEVTALDDCPEMLEQLQSRAGTGLGRNITTICKDSEKFVPAVEYCGVFAANFPMALSTSGLKMIQKLKPGYGIVVFVDNGLNGIKEQIRQCITGGRTDQEPKPPARFMKDLFAAERQSLNHDVISWGYIFKEKLRVLESFYVDYFSLFPPMSGDMEHRIGQILKEFAINGTLAIKTRMKVDILWWKNPS
jgi:SAM-dependent methyltransferase